jgi:hypothetical protein
MYNTLPKIIFTHNTHSQELSFYYTTPNKLPQNYPSESLIAETWGFPRFLKLSSPRVKWDFKWQVFTVNTIEFANKKALYPHLRAILSHNYNIKLRCS